MLEALPRGGKEIKISKAEITMNDLAFLTAKTGDEFTMFTLGSKRMILRGNKEGVRIEKPLALKIKKEKWTWSGHTHPGSTDFVLNASGADREVLEALKQRRSMIANSSGTRNVFDRKNDHHLTSEAAKKAYRETD